MNPEDIYLTTPPVENITEPSVNEEPQVETQPTEALQIQPEPPKPEWQTRYRTPDDMWADVKRFQSEADRLRGDLDRRQTQQQPQPQQPQINNEQLINQFVNNPMGFIQDAIGSVVAPYQAKVALMEFAQSGHPEVLNQDFRREMGSVVERNPALLNDPEALDIIYTYVKTRQDASKLASVAQATQQQVEQTNQIKRTTAFVEGSSPAVNTGPATIQKGMKVADMDRVLDQMGVPIITQR